MSSEYFFQKRKSKGVGWRRGLGKQKKLPKGTELLDELRLMQGSEYSLLGA